MASGFSFGEAAQKLSFVPASSPPDTSASSTDGTASPNVFSTAESKPNRLRKAEVVQRAKFTLPQDASQNVAWPILGLMDSPWRKVDWTEENNKALMEAIHSYKPACDSVPAARVLLLGPVGAGKSSFISSVQSVLYGRVLNRAMVGTSFNSTASFTKQMQSFQLYGSGERDGKSLALILSDMVGLGETNGLTLHDTLAAIKGHVPEGHKFSACCPVVSDTPGYVKEPSLAERVHCVVFVLSGQDISSYPETMKFTFYQLREYISALGVHQVALLTHVDKVCHKTATDISQVYKSSPLKQTMLKASDLLGLPLSSIVPVKNYSEELELDTHTDTLLLKALDHILQYVDLHLRDHPETAHREHVAEHAEIPG